MRIDYCVYCATHCSDSTGSVQLSQSVANLSVRAVVCSIVSGAIALTASNTPPNLYLYASICSIDYCTVFYNSIRLHCFEHITDFYYTVYCAVYYVTIYNRAGKGAHTMTLTHY
jgi:hypothetical protein